MRIFHCDRCEQILFFENVECLRCGAELGFAVEGLRLLTLERDGDVLRRIGTPPSEVASWRRCENQRTAGCNWLVPSSLQELCWACQLTRTRPADGDADGLAALRRAESAKRRLLFQILTLGLPVVPRSEDPAGLAFDLLWAPEQGVTTGHRDGVITLDLSESDDAWRERLRVELGEPYRTLLGHLRHEIGHYYWDKLVSPRDREGSRELFGDETADYAASLERHYAEGPPLGWEETHVSAYATMHPFEDWAETFAHYLHLTDVLETAASVGLTVGSHDSDGLASRPVDALAAGDFDELLGAWVPLSLGLNAVSRSMGRGDLYPFVLAPRVMEKLRFVHHRVQGRDSHT